MSAEKTALAKAILAATTICPRIVHAVAKAGHGPHDDALRRLRVAQLHARDLLTRLEIAELEVAAAAADKATGKEAA